MSFISKWTKPEKASLVERVKNTIKPPPPLKSRIEQAQKKLQLQVLRLDTVSSKLRERDQALFRRIVSAVQQHDMQYSSLLSNELSQIRKISKMVSHAKLALEQIQIRMSTITELGDVVVALNPAMAVVKNVRSGLVGMVPQVDSEMEEISQLLSGILVESA
ncbi:MAG: Snf7 family protein, partial [Nitrososphaerales archaeon]